MTREKLWEVATSPEALLKLCSELLAEREENAVLREENALLEGKAAFFDLFIDMKQSTNLRTTAKELVVPERRFVRFLLEQRFVYRTASGNVLPYAKPSNDGLFCVKDYCNHGHIGSYTLVTPQGKLYFAQLRDSILLMISLLPLRLYSVCPYCSYRLAARQTTAVRWIFRVAVRKEKLIYRNMMPGHKIIEHL